MGWGLPREGAVVEKFVPSLESLSSLGLEGRSLGCPGNFTGMSQTPGGVQNICAKKVCAYFLFPNCVLLTGLRAPREKVPNPKSTL